jgi:hypothetical protein
MNSLVKYQKRKNNGLFQELESHAQFENAQNYIPVYNQIYVLNDSNYNSVNMDHPWVLSKVVEKLSFNSYICTFTHSYTGESKTTRAFIKFAPLLDTCKYLTGKYCDPSSPNSFLCTDILPKLSDSAPTDSTTLISTKLSHIHNAAYIDGLFSFLTGYLQSLHGFVHGIEFYGSFLGIKRNYELNVYDDFDSLIQSSFFRKHANKGLFEIDPAVFSSKQPSIVVECDLDADILEFDTLPEGGENKKDEIKEREKKEENESDLLNDELMCDDDEDEDEDEDEDDDEDNEDMYSCSSRTSNTKSHECESESESESERESGSGKESESESGKERESGSEEGEEEGEEEEEVINVSIPSFPVHLICTEQCSDTLDNLIYTSSISSHEWASILMQIIMMLIAYQKAYSFTHNDLHTNNIMYIPTDLQWIHYIHNGIHYQVPTFGKIFKIIDFGRAIYKFQGNVYSSDSFQKHGDAHSQYNTEPFFNSHKPRIDPNFSFDLCRLGCSIYDGVFDRHEEDCKATNSPIQQLISEWCCDDKGVNVLYKKSGVDRYPGFKLYKMIARTVNAHIPDAQLQRPIFKTFIKPLKLIKRAKKCMTVSIDAISVY